MWRIYTMSELWKLLNEDNISLTFREPTFPTSRWGQSTTKTATTDIIAVNKGIVKLREKGVVVRKRICKETSAKFPKFKKFYTIEIKEKLKKSCEIKK